MHTFWSRNINIFDFLKIKTIWGELFKVDSKIEQKIEIS